MGFKVDIEYHDARLIKYLNTLYRHVKDLRPVFKDFEGEYLQIIKANFDGKGKIFNKGRWAPLSPKYLKWKRKHYSGKRMLELKGTLYGAITGGDGYYRFYKKQDFVFGIQGKPYYPVHQFGNDKTPARPFFMDKKGGIGNRAMAIFVKMADKYIVKDSEK